MTKNTLNLLIASLSVLGNKNKKKTLPYLKRALTELQEEITRLEDPDGGEQESTPQAQEEKEIRNQTPESLCSHS